MIVYISLPMGGNEHTVHNRYEKAKAEISNKYPEAVIKGPVNMSEFTPTGMKSERKHDWAWYMGRDVENLLRCDTIYMTKGYIHSPGCRVELAIARERDMKVIYAEDSRKKLK